MRPTLAYVLAGALVAAILIVAAMALDLGVYGITALSVLVTSITGLVKVLLNDRDEGGGPPGSGVTVG